MILDIIKQHASTWFESIVEQFFNRGLTLTTILGVAGVIVHNFYPHYAAQFDTSLSGILIYMRGGKSATTTTE